MNLGRLPSFSLALCLASLLPLNALFAAEETRSEPAAVSTTQESGSTNVSSDAIATLKSQIAAQQKQIEQLRQSLEAQQKMLDRVVNGGAGSSGSATTTEVEAAAPETKPSNISNSPFARLGEVAGRTPVVPLGPSTPTLAEIRKASSQTPPADISGPLQIHIGNTYISPVGFMDMTAVSRSTNPGSGIGTNFGSIPYDHTQAAALTESRLSIQNSRIGARFDTGFSGYNVIGYWESDFLGQLGNPPNGGLAVSSNPYVFRLRLYWVDVQKNGFEFLAGQSWSLATPNRKGISPLPGDLFYSQDIDVNYQLGLTWGRIPGYRFGYHFSDKAAIAVALENSEPYVGGGNGGSAITAPTAFSAVLGGQINNGSSVISSAALFPDIIAKLALDPSPKAHFELTGIEVADRIANPGSSPAFQTHSNVGFGGELNFNFEVAKGTRILFNSFLSDGAGRYIFGQAPDFVIRSDGRVSNVHSASTVAGIEYTMGKTLYYAYYGGVYIGKNLGYDTNGKTLIGYGPISSDGQNRAIQEITFGTNTTLAKDAKWGALNLMLQYSYLQRNPWLAAPGALSNAHLSMGFLNVRYTLPGAAGPKMYK